MSKKLNKILVLFGAGASIPFFESHKGESLLTTHAINNAIVDKDLWANALVNNSELKENVPHILLLLQKIQGILGETANFEDIAEIVDMVGAFCRDRFSSSVSNFTNLICSNVYGIDYYSLFENEFLSPSYKYLPYFYREIIAEYISNLYTKPPTCYNTMVSLQSEFLKHLTEKYENIKLYTLNYDDCISDSIVESKIDFMNGFDSVTRFNDSSYFSSRYTISYLHGHIRMVNSSRYYATMARNIDEARRNRRTNYSSPFAQHNTNEGQDDFNVFITTGKSKDTSLNYIPYTAYYSKLAYDAFDSNTLIIIGYSFNDLHINRLIEHYLSIDANHHIVIVDYVPRGENGVADLNKYKTSLSQFVRWNGFYGVEDFSNIFDSDTENNSINRNGYGWIMNHRTFLYINGYEQFLKSIDQLLTLIYGNS